MKRLLLLSVALLACTTPAEAMQIGEIARFDNRRPALGRFKVESNVLQDFDRDGIADIFVVRDNILYVIDPVSEQQLWEFSLSQLEGGCSGSGPDPNSVLSFTLDGKGTDVNVEEIELAVVIYDNDCKYLWVVNQSTEVIEFQNGDDPLTLVAVLEHPDNGKQIIAVELDGGRKVTVLIDTSGNSTAGSHASDGGRKLPGFSGGYQLELKFQAEPGWRLAYDPDLFDPRHDMDIDGDERMDLPMIIEDDNNEPIGVVVRGGDNFDVLWQFPFPEEHKENILKGFFGFVNLYGDANKEVVLGENLVVTLDGTVHTIAENFVTLDVNDVDGDGYEDIIGLNTTDSTIVVYGAMTATSVEGYDPAEIHFRLFQNYPNPFNPSTTIAYSVAQPGAVELMVYNLLGQAVRTLFRGQQGAGDYRFTWDGKDDGGRLVSSGPYFYRMKVGQTVRTRSMLFLK